MVAAMFSNKSPAVRQASIIARSSVESVSLASVSARCQRYGARSPMSRDAETDAVEAVKQLSLLESTLLRHRTLTIVGTGWVGSAATHIYLAAEREHRYALPNTRFLIHQPAGGVGGDATDVQIQAKEILKTRERINRIIAEQTGQPLERVAEDTDRDHWMSAEESVAYGIVGKIIRSAAELG